jgi:invasion protein IalB
MTSRSVSSRWRARAATAAAVVALVSALAPAGTGAKTIEKKEAAKPNLVASFGDWNVFVGQAGKGKICYVLAQPKAREPEGIKRDAGYAFISDRPAEGVRNEVSFIMGFEVAGGAAAGPKSDKTEAKVERSDSKPVKPKPKAKAEAKTDSKADVKVKAAPAPVATVGDQSFDLLPKGANVWVKNAARESALIAEMKKGVTLEVMASSVKGNVTTDTYSLTGFSQAMDRLAKECPGKG